MRIYNNVGRYRYTDAAERDSEIEARYNIIIIHSNDPNKLRNNIIAHTHNNNNNNIAMRLRIGIHAGRTITSWGAAPPPFHIIL